MYEEEDDDLPMQYRRLTAHLQTTNADFDRRLAAYLTNHVAMRTALGQAVSDTWAQQQPQYPNAPQFANQMQQYPQSAFPNPMMPPQTMPQRSPTNYRQSPYPMPNQQQGYHLNIHGRSTSHDLHGYSSYPMTSPVEPLRQDDRRMSLPAQPAHPPTPQAQNPVAMTPQSMVSPVTQASPTISRTSSSSNIANLKYEAAKQGFFNKPRNSASPPAQPQQQPTPAPQQPQGQVKSSPGPSPFAFDPSLANFNYNNPFSTSLPAESQQLLGSALDPNDPLTSMLMQGGGPSMPQPYHYNPNGGKPKNASQPFDGMNQTLAPGMLDTPFLGDTSFYNTPPSAITDGVISPWTPAGFGFGFDPSCFSNDPLKPSLTRQNSGTMTPGADGEWQSLINGNVWEEPSSQPTAAT